MKRRRIAPRTDIPDWRDPDMPVHREYIKGTGEKLGPYIDPNFEHRFREHKMTMLEFDHRLPSWRDDPTYYGRKR